MSYVMLEGDGLGLSIGGLIKGIGKAIPGVSTAIDAVSAIKGATSKPKAPKDTVVRLAPGALKGQNFAQRMRTISGLNKEIRDAKASGALPPPPPGQQHVLTAVSTARPGELKPRISVVDSIRATASAITGAQPPAATSAPGVAIQEPGSARAAGARQQRETRRSLLEDVLRSAGAAAANTIMPGSGLLISQPQVPQAPAYSAPPLYGGSAVAPETGPAAEPAGPATASMGGASTPLVLGALLLGAIALSGRSSRRRRR